MRAEADALFDYHLRQMALSLRDQGRIGEGGARGWPASSTTWCRCGPWTGSRCTAAARLFVLTQTLPPRVLGYSETRLGDEDWRVFAAATPLLVQVAQPLAVRRDLPHRRCAACCPSRWPRRWWRSACGGSSASRSRRCSASRRRRARGADSPQALPAEGLPQELQPLVGAFNGLLERLASAFRGAAAFRGRCGTRAAHAADGAEAADRPAARHARRALAGPVRRPAARRRRPRHPPRRATARAGRAEPGRPPRRWPRSTSPRWRAGARRRRRRWPRPGAQITLAAPAPVPMRGDAQALRSASSQPARQRGEIRWPARRAERALPTPAAGRCRSTTTGRASHPSSASACSTASSAARRARSKAAGWGWRSMQAVARRRGAAVEVGTSRLGSLAVTLRRCPSLSPNPPSPALHGPFLECPIRCPLRAAPR